MGEMQPEKDEQVEETANIDPEELMTEEVTTQPSSDGDVQVLQEELQQARAKAYEYLDGW